MNNQFNGMPEIPQNVIEDIYSCFPIFLYFTIEGKGKRKYQCSGCGSTFYRGENILTRTETPNDRYLWHAKHNSEGICPECKAKVKIINSKLQKQPIEVSEAVAFVYANSETDVWVRCAFVVREFEKFDRYCDTVNECMRYHFKQGAAQFWKKHFGFFGWDDEITPMKNFGEAFLWSMGLACYKFPYQIYTLSKLKIEDTFLKYSGFEAYNHYSPNAPMMKYLCWYCLHPQIEMLAKLGHYNVLSELIWENRENKSIIDWNAKKPWDLYKLSKTEYNHWAKSRDLDVLKIFHAIHGSGQKDFETSKKIISLSWNSLKRAKELTVRIKRSGCTPKEAIKYFERISRNSAGCCHHCPGITEAEVADMWMDYIRMASGVNSKSFSPFPSNLKAAHDNLLKREEAERRKKEKAELKRLFEKEVNELKNKYPKANKNLKEIKDKYSYDNGTYCFVMPDSIADVYRDGIELNQCTARPDGDGKNWRYFDRINRNETYIGFVRKSKSPNKPWFTVEFEPGGTVRQKRAKGDSQPPKHMPAIIDFLVEWQGEIAKRLDASDIKKAVKSKTLRLEGFEELRKSKKKINYGVLKGTLLIEALENDILEIETA